MMHTIGAMAEFERELIRSECLRAFRRPESAARREMSEEFFLTADVGDG
jgi:hypothetical protein